MPRKTDQNSLLVVGVLLVALFVMILAFGPKLGKNLGLISQKKTSQEASAKGKPSLSGTSINGCDYSVNFSGITLNVGETKTYNLTYCQDAAEGGYVGWVTWGKIDPSKDLAVTITTPAGQTFTYDNSNNSTESFYDYFANPKGTFIFNIINKGSTNVRYDFAAAAVAR